MYKQAFLKVLLHSGLSVVWEMASYISTLSQEMAEYVPGCIAVMMTVCLDDQNLHRRMEFAIYLLLPSLYTNKIL